MLGWVVRGRQALDYCKLRHGRVLSVDYKSKRVEKQVYSSSSASIVVWAIPIAPRHVSVTVTIKIVVGKPARARTIQISSSSLADASATLLVDLNNTNLLKGLQNLSVDASGSINVVAWTRSPVLGGSVNLS